MEIAWYLIIYIIGVFVSAKFCEDFLFVDEYEIYNNNKKWIVSLIVTLLSFAGLILSFLYCVFIMLFEDVVIDNYKEWAIYKIFFRK